MSGGGNLLIYEIRRVLRSPAVWIVLATVLAAGMWGALNTARLHAAQAADLVRMAQHEWQWYADIRLRAARYAQPSTDEVPYWQDPTGASGFSRYFLRRFAAKPHLPLSVLAVGQSDLQPFAIPLRLETLFGGDRVYDFEPPRALATGPFDLSFLLVFVLPLGLAAAAATIGAHERDQGILPLVAAQPVDVRTWLARRLGSVAIVLVPGTVTSVLVAMTVSGAPLAAAHRETLAVAALVAAHVLFWLSIAGWCLARGQGAVATLSTVAAVWLLLTVAVPLAGSMVSYAVVPWPSDVADVDELRRTTEAVQAEADAIVGRGLVAHLGPNAAAIDPRSLDYSTRLVLITQEMERRLASQEIRRQAYAAASRMVAAVGWWLSPQVAFHTALTDMAGTGTARHERFLEQVRDFQIALREFMYPRVLAQIGESATPACVGCPGRLTFTDYDAIPRFDLRDAPPSSRVAAATRTAAWLTLIAALVATASLVRGARWALAS